MTSKEFLVNYICCHKHFFCLHNKLRLFCVKSNSKGSHFCHLKRMNQLSCINLLDKLDPIYIYWIMDGTRIYGSYSLTNIFGLTLFKFVQKHSTL